MKDSKYKSLFILVIILLVGLIGTSGYIVYEKLFKTDNEIVNNSNQNGDKPNDNTLEEDNQQIALDNLGKKLWTQYNNFEVQKNGQYEYMVIQDGYNYWHRVVIKNNMVTYEDLKNDNRISILYWYLLKNNLYKENYTDDEFWTNRDKDYEKTCDGDGVAKKPQVVISKIDFTKNYQKLWGNDKTIDFNTFSSEGIGVGFGVLKVNNQNIGYYPDCNLGGGFYDGEIFLIYDKTIMNNDNLIVRVKCLNYELKDNIYADIEGNKLIKTLNKTEEDKYLDSPIGIKEDIFIKDFINQATVYEMVFKKDNAKDYYWYSTEMVK